MNETKSSLVLSDNVSIIEEEWGTLQWIVNGTTKTSDTMTLGRVTIRPGMSNPNHVHPNCSEILYVASGIIEHTFDGGTYVEMKAGDAISIPKGIWHHAHNIGNDDAVVIVTFDSALRETIGE